MKHLLPLSSDLQLLDYCILPQILVIAENIFFVNELFCYLQEKYGIEPTMVVHGVKMLYVPVMPGHSKRLKLTYVFSSKLFLIFSFFL